MPPAPHSLRAIFQVPAPAQPGSGCKQDFTKAASKSALQLLGLRPREHLAWTSDFPADITSDCLLLNQQRHINLQACPTSVEPAFVPSWSVWEGSLPFLWLVTCIACCGDLGLSIAASVASVFRVGRLRKPCQRNAQQRSVLLAGPSLPWGVHAYYTMHGNSQLHGLLNASAGSLLLGLSKV